MRIATVLGLLALGAASAAGWAYVAPGSSPTGQAKSTPVVTAQAKTPWVAAAPGRVEPKSGVVRISAGLPARVTDVFVKVNDRVVQGEVLIRLDDVEVRARLASAEAEAAARKRERDAQKIGRAHV